MEPEPEQTDTEKAAVKEPEPVPAADQHSRASAGDVNNSAACPDEGAAPEQPAAAPEQDAAPESAAEESEPVQQQEEEEADAGHAHETEHHHSPPAAHEATRSSQPQQQHQQQQHKHTATAGASHKSIGPGTIYRAADGRVLTFSKPPYTVKAKPYGRIDYSHSKNRLMKIAHDNQLLVDHLTVISKAVPSVTKDAAAPPAPGNTASAAVNRRRKAKTIAQENHALYQRLVAIRPSKDISRDTLEAGYRQNEIYRDNCTQFKPTHSKAAAQAH